MRANKGLDGGQIVFEGGRAHPFLGVDSDKGIASEKRKCVEQKRTVVPIQVVVPVEQEDIVADSDGVELVADVEVGTKSALHTSLTTSNGKTEGYRDVVDDVLQRVTVFNRAEKGRTMACQFLVDRLTIGEVDNLERLKERTDVLG